ncbi:hypothetical protein I41_24280 [Lacipirellula limnantheis]|uniref:Uncharacterized protein n=1 Tax=Lacipirellula limnantheis TaxID=2528024 RepID=A0A517TY04_9BACT|nr:hypothetical protein I41_24280 [Lacipirellula limnantheis]
MAFRTSRHRAVAFAFPTSSWQPEPTRDFSVPNVHAVMHRRARAESTADDGAPKTQQKVVDKRQFRLPSYAPYYRSGAVVPSDQAVVGLTGGRPAAAATTAASATTRTCQHVIHAITSKAVTIKLVDGDGRYVYQQRGESASYLTQSPTRSTTRH